MDSVMIGKGATISLVGDIICLHIFFCDCFFLPICPKNNEWSFIYFEWYYYVNDIGIDNQ